MPRVKDNFIDSERFKVGLYLLDDTTKAPFGSARIMRNMRITDRGGIAPRLGTSLLGTFNSSASFAIVAASFALLTISSSSLVGSRPQNF